ncbi:MAG: hypothetical protein V3V19_02195 [Cocleimonas sp.]
MKKTALFGKILFFIGLIMAVVGLIFGFGLMFQGGNDIWATRFLIAVAIGFMLMFTGLATSVMFAPYDNDQELNKLRSLQDSDDFLSTEQVQKKEKLSE